MKKYLTMIVSSAALANAPAIDKTTEQYLKGLVVPEDPKQYLTGLVEPENADQYLTGLVVPQDAKQEPIDQDLTQGEMLASAAIVGGAATGLNARAQNFAAQQDEMINLLKEQENLKNLIQKGKLNDAVLKELAENEKNLQATKDSIENTKQSMQQAFQDMKNQATKDEKTLKFKDKNNFEYEITDDLNENLKNSEYNRNVFEEKIKGDFESKSQKNKKKIIKNIDNIKSQGLGGLEDIHMKNKKLVELENMLPNLNSQVKGLQQQALDEDTLKDLKKFLPDLQQNATLKDLSTELNKKEVFYKGVAPQAPQGLWARFKNFIKGGLSAQKSQEFATDLSKGSDELLALLGNIAQKAM